MDKSKLKLFFVFLYLFSIPVACQIQENKEQELDTNKIDSIYVVEIDFEEEINDYPLDSVICDGFDYPVGNPDGKGSYVSLVDGKKYNSWAVSVPFGINYSLGIHPGEDWGGTGPSDSDLGQPVYSIANGVVIYAEDYDPPWGNIVMIRHIFKEKEQLDTVFSIYTHLKDLYVKRSQLVKRRDSIGTVGDGGIYRPHLHFEIRKNTLKDQGANFWPSSDGRNKAWVLENYFSPSKFIRSHRKL